MSVHDVAASILSNFESGMSTMKLQKLCYFAQGWSLAIADEPLFAEDFQAWKNGPVCYELFDRHRGQYSVDDWNGDPNSLSERDLVILDAVLENYGALSGLQLSEMTHAPDGAWATTRADDGAAGHERSNAVISKETIKKYFHSLLFTPRPTTAEGI